jgi:hypothetical protein
LSTYRFFHFLLLSLASSIALTAHCGEAVASEAPRNGDYLAKLSGLTQLSVDNADQAAIYVDAEGNATRSCQSLNSVPNQGDDWLR